VEPKGQLKQINKKRRKQREKETKEEEWTNQTKGTYSN
jgi:hypothetical protein